jgi:hypothetical protein
MVQQLILKRASASRPSGEWNDDDFDVLADGAVVGRIFKANASPVGTPWMWTLAFKHHEDRRPTHGCTAPPPLRGRGLFPASRRLLKLGLKVGWKECDLVHPLPFEEVLRKA